uniref:Uncharacterized protein n=1 Tax=Arundo donax TaxID=35708 RepID=A0A0A9EDC3_ARUDO
MKNIIFIIACCYNQQLLKKPNN